MHHGRGRENITEMEKKKIAILFGGCSNEYSVALDSSYSVIESMDRDLYDVLLIGVSAKGDWYLYEGDIAKIPEDKWLEGPCKPVVASPNRSDHGLLVFEEEDGKEVVKRVRIDAAFPVMHGKNGEDGTVQGIFELAGIPVVGCGMTCSAVCMDKALAHEAVAAAGVQVPRSFVMHKKLPLAEVKAAIADYDYPIFVKPIRGGSSIGITKVHDISELPKALDDAFEWDNGIIIEEGIPGFEVGCSVIGNPQVGITVSQPDEIELFVDHFDYNEKYTQKYTKIHMPARVDAETAKRLRKAGATIYEALGCNGMARVDMFLTPDKEIYFNEVNTIPGLTSHSRFPKMLGGIGIDYKTLIDKLIGMALEE